MVDIAEVTSTCKSEIFKSVLNDLVYSFRLSIKKLTSATLDIKLTKIRLKPICIEGAFIVGKIRNLVGGKIICVIDNNMVKFLNSNLTYAPETTTEIFAIDFFDCFISTSRHKWLNLNTDNIEMSTCCIGTFGYYINFDVRIFTTKGKPISSKFIISIDEIASMYFRDY